MDRRLKSFKTIQLVAEIVNFIGAPFAFCVQLFFSYISVSMNIEANKVLEMNFELFVFGITLLSIIVIVALGIASICLTRKLVILQKNNASLGELKRRYKTLQILRGVSLLTVIIGLVSILITLFRGSVAGNEISIEYALPMLLCFFPVWGYYIVECILSLITFIKLETWGRG